MTKTMTCRHRFGSCNSFNWWFQAVYVGYTNENVCVLRIKFICSKVSIFTAHVSGSMCPSTQRLARPVPVVVVREAADALQDDAIQLTFIMI